ncbi:hypothetical protein CCMSSC00406_0008911 [Pleurotus cornucopiae]|uniref:Uncharacterized protein n=1 Tax=Pleurotus cornucopiae TaxID=5321 RepID=A0ACB7IU55_PLECO|nr:hypothetical protein CCMSSC00406_0008911 [Pleurotus cornucopiae]
MASDSHDAVNFSSDEGRAYARSLLRRRIPHEIHDHILEGICKAVDGIHVLSVLKTGGGKTSYFYGYMHMLQALGSVSPTPRFLHRKLPKNPTMVIIFPTKGLEEEMESTFRAYGLSALAINEDTLAAAQRRGDDLWKQACSGRVSMILVSPEQLVSRSFDRLLHTKAFAESLCALGLDEMHLITDWGDTSFRKAFTDIGLVLARMKSTTTLIAVTATLPAADVNRIVHVLGLAPGSYFFTRRSNIRSDIQFITRILRHGLGGWSFPDFDWIVKTKRKTIVYADTVTLAHRLFVYFWSLSPSSHHDRFRMYCAPCASSYNKETRDLFEHDPNLQVVLATDALKVGNNWPNIADAVIINPKNPNDIVQKGGRVGRQPGLVRNPGPRAFVYIPSSMAKRAASIIASPRPSGQKLGGKADDLMTLDMAQLLLADCVTDVLNALYHNPISDPPCSCRTCQSPVPTPSSCVCSGCCPEEPLPKLSRRISPPSSKLSLSIFPDSKRAIAREKLRGFRWGLWEQADTPLLQHMSPAAFLPDSRIDLILDNIHRITTASQLLPFIQDLRVLQECQFE